MADDWKLPAGWFVAHAEDGEAYFYNETTGETSWDPPAGSFPKVAPAGAGASDQAAAAQDSHALAGAASSPATSAHVTPPRICRAGQLRPGVQPARPANCGRTTGRSKFILVNWARGDEWPVRYNSATAVEKYPEKTSYGTGTKFSRLYW